MQKQVYYMYCIFNLDIYVTFPRELYLYTPLSFTYILHVPILIGLCVTIHLTTSSLNSCCSQKKVNVK